LSAEAVEKCRAILAEHLANIIMILPWTIALSTSRAHLPSIYYRRASCDLITKRSAPGCRPTDTKQRRSQMVGGRDAAADEETRTAVLLLHSERLRARLIPRDTTSTARADDREKASDAVQLTFCSSPSLSKCHCLRIQISTCAVTIGTFGLSPPKKAILFWR